jgi:SAM-dependent methyltransferase
MTSLTTFDPLARAPRGRYADDFVIVRFDSRTSGVTATLRDDDRIEVTHGIDLADLDDDLAERLADALAPCTDEHDVFARAFLGVVTTTHADPLVAWRSFYDNSLARLDDPTRAGYAVVYRHALTLLPHSSVLDLGCGFGFLALRLAGAGVRTTAVDVEPGTIRLLTTMSENRGVALPVLQSEPVAVPLPDDSIDAVALLHVLEHLDAATGAALLREAMRIARSRVVVAVPYEDTPTRLYGHVRRMTAAVLHDLGLQSGWPFTVHEHCGGWLVLTAEGVSTQLIGGALYGTHLAGHVDGLGSPADVELAHDVRNVELRRRLGHEQRPSDGAVRHALREQAEYLDLPRRQRLRTRVR